MPRRHIKRLGSRTYANYTTEQLNRAVQEIKAGRISLREASKRYKISLGTLSRKCRNKHMNTFGRPTVLSKEEESKIVEGLLVAAEWGFPLTTHDLRNVIKTYLDSSGRTERRFKNNTPGKDWVYHFRERHPVLSNRLCENIKRNRAQVSREAITSYFQNLETSLQGVPPEAIINYDESNLSDDPGRSKVLVRRGSKHPERCLDTSKMSTSIMMSCTAGGELLPPYVIYRAIHMYESWRERGPKKARYNCTKSGWIDTAVFEDWFIYLVLPYMKKLGPGPKALIGDNLSSHLSERVIEECRNNNIRFILLPPNSTHLCQPLDVAFFRPMKTAWKKQLLKWKQANQGTVPKSQFPALLKETLESMNENMARNIKSGFRASGVYPLDKNEVLKRLPDKNVAVDESLLSSALKQHLNEMRFAKAKNPEPKRKRMMVEPGKSVSGTTGSSSDSDTDDQISLHDSESSIGEPNFTDESEDQRDSDGQNQQSEDEHNLISDGPIQAFEKDVASEATESKSVDIGDYLLVRFGVEGKTSRFLKFVGKVTDINGDDKTYVCKFLRQIRLSRMNFYYPDVEDICVVDYDQIVEILDKPVEYESKVCFREDINI